MNLSGKIGASRPFGGVDVLSIAEEEVLAEIREIVSRVRTQHIGVDLAIVESALKSAGALRAGDAGESEAMIFGLRGTHFLLRLRSGERGGVKVCFLPERQ